jgi:hypothetical protein
MRVIAFVSDLWRKRFGWDGPRDVACPEDLLLRHGIDPEAFKAALREAVDAQPDPLVYRSRKRKEIP